MSDPLSAAGSAVGVVSLGITACQGLLSFYQGWKAYDSDLDQAAARSQEFSNSLKSLRATLQQFLNSPSNTSQETNKIIDLCERAIKDLEDYLLSCRQTKTDRSRAAKFQGHIQRLRYPLRKRNVEDLKGTITELRRNLATLLSILALELQVQHEESISASHQDIQAAIATTQSTVRNDTQEIIRTSHDMSCNLARTLPQITDGIANLEINNQQRDKKQEAFQQQVLMLLAKPAALKDACDISRENYPFARRRPKTCKCGRGEILAQRRLAVGQISAIYDSLIPHRRSCPLWSSIEQTQNFGFEVSSQHLKVAIQLGMSINRGAGGVSIGPMLLLRG